MSRQADAKWSYGQSGRRSRSLSRSTSLHRNKSSRSTSRHHNNPEGKFYSNGNEQTHVITFKPPRSKPKDTPLEAERKSKARQMIQSFLTKDESGNEMTQLYTDNVYRAPSTIRTPDTSMDMSDVRSVGSITSKGSRGSRASFTSKGSKSSIVSIRKLKSGGSKNPPTRPQRRSRSRQTRRSTIQQRSVSRGRSVTSRGSATKALERVKSFRRSLSRVSARSLSRVKSLGRSKSREPKWKRQQRKEARRGTHTPRWKQSKWTSFWQWFFTGGKNTRSQPNEKRIYVRAEGNPDANAFHEAMPAQEGGFGRALCNTFEPLQDYLCVCEDDESLIGRVIGEDDPSIAITTSSPEDNEEDDDIRWSGETDGKEAIAPPPSPDDKDGGNGTRMSTMTTPNSNVKTLSPSPRDSPHLMRR